jgi:phytoene dehydrogenase-like protein
MASESSSTAGQAYDAIVIGSGAGGLTCATRLAQAGLRVALLEKNEWLGGYSHGFSKDGFYWDHGGHIFLAYKLGAQAREVFQRLRIDQVVEMVPETRSSRWCRTSTTTAASSPTSRSRFRPRCPRRPMSSPAVSPRSATGSRRSC